MFELFDVYVMPVLRLSTPLIFAALGGLWCERSGVIQIGLEGFILLGSFFGAVAALQFNDPWIGLFSQREWRERSFQRFMAGLF